MPQKVISEVEDTLRKDFALQEELVALPGGEGRTFRSGAFVLRREEDREQAAWTANLFADVPLFGCRAAKPFPTSTGAWVNQDGFSCWSHLNGSSATAADLLQVIPAIESFHKALENVARPPWLPHADTLYARADRVAWGEADVKPTEELKPFIAALLQMRRPISLREQLIHGDLNEENILVAVGEVPAVIDFTPYWRPPGYGLAILAYWLGAFRGDMEVLGLFSHIPEFDQLLVRAALREVLINDEFLKIGRPVMGGADKLKTPERAVSAWLQRVP